MKLRNLKYRGMLELQSPENNDMFWRGIGLNKKSICNSLKKYIYDILQMCVILTLLREVGMGRP